MRPGKESALEHQVLVVALQCCGEHVIQVLIEGLYHVVSIWCCTFSSKYKSFMSLETKGIPWSIRMSMGMPTQLKRSASSCAIFFEVVLQNGTVSE